MKINAQRYLCVHLLNAGLLKRHASDSLYIECYEKLPAQVSPKSEKVEMFVFFSSRHFFWWAAASVILPKA